jgi:hypothetical protein
MSENVKIPPELVVSPGKIKARQGVFQVVLTNKENFASTYRLSAADPGGLCSYSFDKETVTLEAGGTANIALTVRFNKTPIVGTSKVCDFSVIAIKGKGESIAAGGQLECPSRFPVWALSAGGLAVAAIIVVVVVLASSGGSPAGLPSNGSATTTPTASVTATPSPTAGATSPSITPTPTASTPSATPTATQTTSTPSSTPTVTPTISPTPTPTPTSTPTPAPAIPDLAGQWRWDVTVTFAAGVCAGEEGVKPTRIVEITQLGKDITVSGFPNPAKILTGDVTLDGVTGKWVVKLQGSYPEDEGITTGEYTLELNSTFDEMTGNENWNWVGGGGSCPGSTSAISAKKN